MPHICFLSGLEIPKGKYSVEHLVAKYWIPSYLANLPSNKYPAIKIINSIKDIKMPCEWFDMRYDLTYHAYLKWHLKQSDKQVIIQALDRFATEKDTLNPCQHCILSTAAKEYCYARRDLEKYRVRWLYGLQFGKGETQR
ncbi:MAG: hypothetical protein J6S85_19035 [Methanobrevibacter sp.]|nr:hypothetical protein [Methanobrevibacter sp.]